MKRNNGGFTLVELLVTISVGSIVLAAVASLLLFGLRIQKAAQEEAGEQQTVRIVFSMLEELSASGKIYRVEPISENREVLEAETPSEEAPPTSGWHLVGNNSGTPGSVLLTYKSGKLYGGDGTVAASVLLDGLRAARVDLDGGLLTFTFKTKDHSYSTSVFCRTGVQGDSTGSSEALENVKNAGGLVSDPLPAEDSLTPDEKNNRYAFLQVLAGEYGSSGQIFHKHTNEFGLEEPYQYYSEWYIHGYKEDSLWNKDTPWCACFLSWAAETANLESSAPRFADVDDGMKAFQSQGAWRNDDPIPGDYVFFDWSGGNDPDHVGAVLCVEDGKIYTIEGNSGGKVTVQSYDLNDPRIVGYGVLDWKK